jgi:tRNA(Arg) A34 adenosine deaminase TadA
LNGGVNDDDERHLLVAIELAWQARNHGNHPFGALLVDADGHVVLGAENTVVTGPDCTGHAETNLMRMASGRFSPEFLYGCVLYTSTEPCAMCAGAIYWGNVRRVVFALSEEELGDIVGGNPDNPTLALPCRCSHEASTRSRSAVPTSSTRRGRSTKASGAEVRSAPSRAVVVIASLLIWLEG